jgi:tetratricopeptide (TPR) repeat protein
MTEHSSQPNLPPVGEFQVAPVPVGRLITLGGLLIEGVNFRREKPLLLAAHLALEGPWSRRQLAERFYPDVSNPMNSLAVTINKLRKFGLVEADWVYAWSLVSCDVTTVREHIAHGRLQEAVEAYTGGFAASIGEVLESDLGDWVVQTRETLAGEVREAILTLAERDAATGDFVAASERAMHAYRLPGASLLEPEALLRVHRLLLAGEHPGRDVLEREAKEFGVSLTASVPSARGVLRRVVLGRERELELLSTLRPGDWAWLQGASGMGKTTLMHELEAREDWVYLPARDGLPYATLEPILPSVNLSEDALLYHLRQLEKSVLIDDHHLIDPQSRALIERWRTTRPNARVVIAAHHPPEFRTEQHLELQPLNAEALREHPGAFEHTNGLPALVGAWLRGEPLEHKIDTQLHRVTSQARHIHAALTLAPTPDRELVRRALDLSAPDLAANLEQLVRYGLIEPGGQVRGLEAAKRNLHQQPELEARTALALARYVTGEQAFPLFKIAHGLWTEEDEPRVRRAYLDWAKELLRRGFPDQAISALEDAPNHNTVQVLRVRALERAGKYPEAHGLVMDCEGPEARALEAKLLWRLGKPEEAKRMAQQVMDGPMEARAEALNTLGKLALAAGENEIAIKLHQQAAILWNGLGEQGLVAQALNNVGGAMILLGMNPISILHQSVVAAGADPSFQVHSLINTGHYYLQSNQFKSAESFFAQAAEMADQFHLVEPASVAWGNLGVALHYQERLEDAEQAYELALKLAQQSGDRMAIGNFMANLAEVRGDLVAWEEAAYFLEDVGWSYLAELHRQQIAAFKLRSSQQENT